MKSISLVLPSQLYKSNLSINKLRDIIIFEHPYFFERLNYHKKKLIFHRATLKKYFEFLKSENYNVIYLEFDQDLFDYLKKNKIKSVHIIDPIEKKIKIDFENKLIKYDIKIIYYDSPGFINNQESINELMGNFEKYNFTSFYIKLRKKSNILIDNFKPIGGNWTYDKYNREVIPDNLKIKKSWQPKQNNFVIEAISYVNKKFSGNLGVSDNFFYPISFDDSEKWFDDFLINRFSNFGIYQDCIRVDENLLFHSLLSPLLNVGLLTPDFVINRALIHYKKVKIPLNSCEGFIRQVLGWREFIYGIYLLKSEYQQSLNYFKHKRKIPKSFWLGQTGIEPIDIIIKKILETGYAHHIERLMVLGNFMLLCEFDPAEVYKWFMEFFIDSYDWVMIPNVYGMSQYADGGLMSSKPYLSSSNYLKKMSNYKADNWCEIWDSLYWRFIYKNKKKFENNPRSKVIIWQLNKMSEFKIKKYIEAADDYLNNL